MVKLTPVAGEIRELTNLLNPGNKSQEKRERSWEITEKNISVISQPRLRNSRKLQKCEITEIEIPWNCGESLSKIFENTCYLSKWPSKYWVLKHAQKRSSTLRNRDKRLFMFWRNFDVQNDCQNTKSRLSRFLSVLERFWACFWTPYI